MKLTSPTTHFQRGKIWPTLVGALTAVLLVACTPNPPAPTNVSDGPSATPQVAVPPSPTPEPEPEPVPSTFNIAAAGDILPHIPVLQSAKVAAGYDFAPLLAGIDPIVDQAALALCHMEVPLLEEGQKPSGYPMFGSTPLVADSLAAQGWDGCSTASNHSVDKGFSGVVSTIDRLESLGMGFTGTARTQEEATAQLYRVDHDDYQTVVAHLSYTEFLNGLPKPKDAPFAVNIMDAEVIIADATAAREVADLVVVSIHDGTEYQTAPNQSQLDIAAALADSGVVDLYIGHHAHVPQPIELLPGGPRQEGMWTAYGLGNMLSNQSKESCCVAQTSNGLMMLTQVERNGDEPARVTGVSWRALTVDRHAGHRLYDLTELAAAGQGMGKLSAAEVAARHDLVVAAVGDQAPEALDLPQDGYASVTVLPRTP